MNSTNLVEQVNNLASSIASALFLDDTVLAGMAATVILLLFLISGLLSLKSHRQGRNYTPETATQLAEVARRLRGIAQYLVEDKVYAVRAIMQGTFQQNDQSKRVILLPGVEMNELQAALRQALGNQALVQQIYQASQQTLQELRQVQQVRSFAHDEGFNDSFTAIFRSNMNQRYQLSCQLSDLAVVIEQELGANQPARIDVTQQQVAHYS